MWMQGLAVLARTFVVATDVTDVGVVELGCMAGSLSLAPQRGARDIEAKLAA